MIANYGYKDGSGEYFIIVDTDRCDGCAKCVDVCPQTPKVLAVEPDDYDEMKVLVTEEHRKKIKYSCAQCKPVSGDVPIPCVDACPHGAITHSW